MSETGNNNINMNNPEMTGSQEVSTQQKSAVNEAKSRYRKHKVKTGFYYSFLTIVLIFCVVHVGFGAILNISKTVSYRAKINTLEKVRDDAEARNQDLKDDIKQFSSTASLEGIARNNLKMAGENEVLLIINKDEPVEVDKEEKKK